MSLPPSQATLKDKVSFSGVGIHTAQATRVTLCPAGIDRGRYFVTASGIEIPARVDFVIACDRATVLGCDTARVSTPEHLLSALWAAGIDNVEIQIEGEEVPILDGSALVFWQGIKRVGVEEQGVPAKLITVDAPIGVGEAAGPMVLLRPSTQTSFEAVLSYDHPLLGTQVAEFAQGEDYGARVAGARTFALWEEVEPLLERGRALGGSLDNALIVYRDRYSAPLRLHHEPAVHKCLDLIGDFALLGARIQGKVLAVRAGHRWHVDAVRKLFFQDLGGGA